jgi:hypothetical protein
MWIHTSTPICLHCMVHRDNFFFFFLNGLSCVLSCVLVTKDGIFIGN